MVLKRNPDIIPDLGGGENYRVLKHGPNLLKRLCSLGGGRNYRVLKLGNMPKATVDIQPSDFRFGWGRNYMVLKLVLLPIHSIWWRKSYMVLKLRSCSFRKVIRVGRR